MSLTVRLEREDGSSQNIFNGESFAPGIPMRAIPLEYQIYRRRFPRPGGGSVIEAVRR